MKALNEVTDQGFAKALAVMTVPIVIAIVDTTLYLCQLFLQELTYAAEILGQRAFFFFICTEENPSIGKEHGVHSVPTTLIYRRGRETDRILGPCPGELLKKLRSAVKRRPA